MVYITLFFLIIFTLLYVNKSIANKPAFLAKATDKIVTNIDDVSFYGFIYAIVAFFLTPILIHGDNAGLLIRMLANAMIAVMAIPYAMDNIVAKLPMKMNETVLGEFKSTINSIVQQEKIVGYAGVAMTVIFFAVIFR